MKSSPQGRERPAVPISGPIALFGALRGAKAGAAGAPMHPLSARQQPLRAARKKRSAVLRQQTSPVRLVRLMSAGSLPPCRTKITSFSLKSKYSPTFILARRPRTGPPLAASAPAETGRKTRQPPARTPGPNTRQTARQTPDKPTDRCPGQARQPRPMRPAETPGRAPAIRVPRAPPRSRARRRARPSRGWRCGGCGRQPASSGTPS